jgi:hypothetical protein
MTILYYDETKPKEELHKIVKGVREVTQDKVIALPKNFDILLDCSLDQLISAKGILDTAISLKIQREEPSTNILQ